MTQRALIDPPSPFAPTKQLQDFMAEWKGRQEARDDPFLGYSLDKIQQELDRRAYKGGSLSSGGSATSSSPN